MDATEIGAFLRDKRIEQKLSVDDIVERINVTAQTVERIENGEHDKLAGDVFVRGYIRYYARILGVNPNELLESEEKQLVEMTTDEDTDYGHDERVLKNIRTWGSIVVITILLLLIYTWWAENDQFPDDREVSQEVPEYMPDDTADLSQEVPDDTPNDDTDTGGASRDMFDDTDADPTLPDQPATTQEAISPYQPTPYRPTQTTEDAEDASEATDGVAGQQPGVIDGVEDDAVIPSQQEVTDAEPPPAGMARVALETGEYESWIQVTDAGGVTLEEVLLAPYSQLSLYGKAPFDFRIGYVRGVTLRIDGEIYDFSRHEDRGLAFFRAP